MTKFCRFFIGEPKLEVLAEIYSNLMRYHHYHIEITSGVMMDATAENFLRDNVYPKIAIGSLSSLSPLLHGCDKSTLKCPYCGTLIKHVVGRGDVSCRNCGNMSLFDLHLALGFTSEFAFRSLCDGAKVKLPKAFFSGAAFHSRLKKLKDVLKNDTELTTCLKELGATDQLLNDLPFGAWAPSVDRTGTDYSAILEPSLVVPYYGKYGLNLAYITMESVRHFHLSRYSEVKFVNPEPWPVLFRNHKVNKGSMNDPIVTSHPLLAVHLLHVGIPCLLVHRGCTFDDRCYALEGDPVISIASLPNVNLISLAHSVKLFEVVGVLKPAPKSSISTDTAAQQTTTNAAPPCLTENYVIEFIVLRVMQGMSDVEQIKRELNDLGVRLCIQN